MAGVLPCNFEADGLFNGVCSLFQKNVFFSHPVEVVLSVIDRAQSPGHRRFDIKSIHGVMMEAMNSRRLLDARKRQFSGSSSLQAKPPCEYPPSP